MKSSVEPLEGNKVKLYVEVEEDDELGVSTTQALLEHAQRVDEENA